MVKTGRDIGNDLSYSDSGGVRPIWIPFLKRLCLLLLILILIVGIFTVFSFKRGGEEADVIINGVDTGLLETFLSDIRYNTRVLLVLADTVAALLEEPDGGADSIPGIFRTVLETDSDIFQVRYLDSRGMEIHRLDRIGETLVRTTPENLQMKSHRYYFTETVVNPPGTVYISPLDLNIEHQEVEVPWRPTLRLATPIPDVNNGGKGIVIINVDYGRFLEKFSQGPGEGRVYFLDGEGYYLAGEETDRLFSFMFDKNDRFSSDYPEVWEKIREGEPGSALGYGKQFVYTPIRLRCSSLETSALIELAAAECWVIVAAMPIFPLSNAPVWEFLLLGSLILLVLGIAWYWTRVERKRTQALLGEKRARAALLRSREMALLGRMIAGVAHELNTPIGTCQTVSDSIQRRIDEHLKDTAGSPSGRNMREFFTDLTPYFRTLDKGLGMAVSLISEFKAITFNRKDEPYQEFPLVAYLQSAVEELQDVEEDSRVGYVLQSDREYQISSFPGILVQAYVNMVEYASAKGFPDGEPGRVFIDIGKNGRAIVVSVRYRGVPFSKDDLEHLYQPFSRLIRETKDRRFGLYVSIYILENLLEGSIDIKILPDGWTHIRTELPRRIERNGGLGKNNGQ